MIQIKPKVGDLIQVKDHTFAAEVTLFGYCVKSEEGSFTLFYFDNNKQFEYWYDDDEDYGLEMSIISTGQHKPNNHGGLETLMISEDQKN